MQKLSILRQRAIEAAKALSWQEAVSINQQILEQDPADLVSMNRLGLAFMQLEDKVKAKQMFEQVIAADKSNLIANKNLGKLKTNQPATITTFANNYFIEEPGKTKIADLHRLANKNTLNELSVGQNCTLAIKNHYISVVTLDGKHVGALPEDISFRITKLISRGNEYSCVIHSVTEKACRVLIRETKVSKQNANLQSFPPTKAALNNLNQGVDDFLLDDDIPVQVLDTQDADAPNIESALEGIEEYRN